MNLILILLVSITTLDFIFNKVLDWLNDLNKSPNLPQQGRGIYDEEKYAKWLAYDKANGRIDTLSSGLSVVLSLVLLGFGFFGWLDTELRAFIDNQVILGLVYFGVLGLGSSIISMPFSVWQTFVIEEKFGFNKTTLKTFILDVIKGAALTVVVGGVLGGLLIWLFYELADHFWWIAWIVISGFSLFMAMFGASLIMPMFNKFTPLPAGELRSEIEAYCAKVGFQVQNLFVIDGSKRSAKSNAFFSGLGPKKRIALYDTLIEQLSTKEIVAVLAHEVGHYKKKHTQQSLMLSVIQTGVMMYLVHVFVRFPEISEALGAEQASLHVGIIAFGILFSPISTVLGIIMNVRSRKNEFEADHYAKTTFDGKALASSLEVLTRENLSNLTPHPAYVFVHYSHPPVLERLERLSRP